MVYGHIPYFLIGRKLKESINWWVKFVSKKAALPLIAAVGVFIFPPALFIILKRYSRNIKGWGILLRLNIALLLAYIWTYLGKPCATKP